MHDKTKIHSPTAITWKVNQKNVKAWDFGALHFQRSTSYCIQAAHHKYALNVSFQKDPRTWAHLELVSEKSTVFIQDPQQMATQWVSIGDLWKLQRLNPGDHTIVFFFIKTVKTNNLLAHQGEMQAVMANVFFAICNHQ